MLLVGNEGGSPELPVAFEALEDAAKAEMEPEAFDYAAGGAGRERTIDSNQRAFDRWQIVPRMLRDIAARPDGELRRTSRDGGL